MSPLWLVPGLVVVLGGVLLVALVRAAGEEARLLADELTRQRAVAEAIRSLGSSMRTLGGRLPTRR